MSLLQIASRGWLIVLLTACNVGAIAGRHWTLAFVGGCAISYVWWANSRTAAHVEQPFAREAYALGAGLGTLSGMLIVRLLYG